MGRKEYSFPRRGRKAPPGINDASGPRKKRKRGDSWQVAKKAWYDLRTNHLDTRSKNHVFRWIFKGPVSGTLSIPVTPPTSFCRGLCWNPHLFRIPTRELTLKQQQYALLIRMFNILRFFEIHFEKLPRKKQLPGMLRSCATKITQIGFSQGQVFPLPKAMA